jgi:hypothetical protein
MTESSATDGMIPKMAGMTAVALVLGVGVAYLFHIADRPVARHVPAEPYVWPVGCKPAAASYDTDSPNYVRYYRGADEIPKACMDPEYHIADPGKYGLIRSQYRSTGLIRRYGRGREYYRIGPDAVEIFCLSDGRCFIDHVENDVFQDTESSHK